MQSIKFKSTKQPFDMKKSLAKLLDPKRECFSRLRALRSICDAKQDAKDLKEVKKIFDDYRSVIFAVFHETFILLDSAKSNGHQKNTTEDDRLLFFIFEKILLLLPKHLQNRWHMNSLIFIFKKCLIPTNLLQIRLQSMRLFLIYYQILGEENIRSNQQIEILYASLIPGIVTDMGFTHQHLSEFPITDKNYMKYGIRPFPIEPFIKNPDQSLNSLNNVTIVNANNYPHYEYKNYTKLIFLQNLLDYQISQCIKIHWDDNERGSAINQRMKGFAFLFDSFVRIYLPYIFPKFYMKEKEKEWPDYRKNYDKEREWQDYTFRKLFSIYQPPNEIPKLRKFRDNYSKGNEQLNILQATIIQWFTKYLLGKESLVHGPNSTATLTPKTEMHNISKYSSSTNLSSTNSTHLSSSSSTGFLFNNQSNKIANNQISATFEFECEIYRLLLNSKRSYVDLILNLFHQAFLWPFNEDLESPMRDVIKVYRQWINKETTNPLPLFLAEPNTNIINNTGNITNSATASVPNQLLPHYSNDDNVCAGYMNMLYIFIISSANVFLLEVPSEMNQILDRQVDACKRVFNIYRYMVMKIEMERNVWEILVQILIRVTECITSPELPIKREDNLGGRLAPALFQTLIVTWIKANLNIPLPNQLWEKFHQLISSLTLWEELIAEWQQTMFILNRVSSRYVFNINLTDLPLDKTISDRKREIRNKPRLHHIRSISNNVNQNDKTQVNNVNNNFPAIQNHDQISRTSSNPDSVRSCSKMERICSNDLSSEPKYITNAKGKIFNKISTPQLHIISVNRHRDYHKNHLINRVLKRSLSDSCLVLTVQRSLCPIRTNIKFHHQRRSCKLSSTKKYLKKILNNRYSTGKNLPMIDDEIDEEDSCTLSETIGIIDYHDSDAISAELSDGDDTSLNEYLMIDYLCRRILFRMNSTNDIDIVSNKSGNINHNNVNGSDSIAETISIGASAQECNSLKETALAFDTASAASTCSGSMAEQQMSFGSESSSATMKQHFIDTNSAYSRTVLLGGQLRGWNAEAAAILWRRMLEILGDINNIRDPILHRQSFECLTRITEDFIKIRDNITYLNATLQDNFHTLVPSLHYYNSWLFRATTLPPEFKSGRLMAYKLLCTIAMYRSEQELSKEFLILFYLSLKRAIISYDMDLINIILKYLGTKFFAASLWGSSCLLFQFVSAANVVIGSVDNKTYPRNESIQLLGSLIGFFDVFSNVLCLRSAETLSLEPYVDLKDHVIDILISASKREQNGLGRVISFCSLAIFLYREFMKGSQYIRIKDIINILIAGTRFTNRILCRVVCDLVRLLADHVQYLMAKQPDLVRRIIEGLCYTFELHLGYYKQNILLKDFKNLLLCIMFCLSHWCMSVSKEFLLNTLVSEEYPGKMANVDKNKLNESMSNKPCLMDLVTSLYISVFNIDPAEVVKNQSKSQQNDACINSSSIGDMDTIDYTIMNNNSGTNENIPMSGGKSHMDQNRLLNAEQIKCASTIQKAAHLILLHFMNFMGHFPMAKLRTASLSALINENDDNPYVASNQTDKVDYEALNAPNVLVFTVNDICLMSFVELSAETFESTIWSKLSTSSNSSVSLLPAKPIRIIIRNILGKFSWDCMMLVSPVCQEKNILSRPISSLTSESITSQSPEIDDDEEEENAMNSFKNSLIKDKLELLVDSIHEISPECQTKANNPDFLMSLNQLPEAVDTVALLINQHYQECQYNEQPNFFTNRQSRMSPDKASYSDSSDQSKSSNDNSSCDLLDTVKAFQYCRQIIEHFGFLSWEKRKQIEMLSKSQSTIRELRHLDNQQCRDKHKIAVVYVGPGQETKESILLNKSGSRAFEEFVSRLGWEINLATHVGYMGGLQSNLSTGLTAPYYADSFNEVIFHVSTRLEPVTEPNGQSSQPIDRQQLINTKMRHLGNDEIHIIWSEYYKEYRRSILATEFADVLIVIYPLPANTFPNLFRIQLMRKADVPFFGPLFHGAVIHRDELPGLVRATAINASRTKRLNMENYTPSFEERYDIIKKLATTYKEPSTFEEFANRIYAPRYDLLKSEQMTPTTDPTSLLDHGFITLEDFVQSTMPSATNGTGSIPSTPHSSAIEPISPASSTMSNEISFGMPISPAPLSADSAKITANPLMMPINSGTSLRGLRPNSRTSIK